MKPTVLDSDRVHRRVEVRVPGKDYTLAKLELCDCSSDGVTKIDKLRVNNTFMHDSPDPEQTAENLRAVSEWAEQAADAIEEEL